MDEKKEFYSSTIRIDASLARRLHIISQVLGETKVSLISFAIKQMVFDKEADPDFQAKKKALLELWSS